MPPSLSLDRILSRHPRCLLLLLVLASTWVVVSGGLLSDDAVPFGDGEHYALRALSLYGFLHAGHGHAFWDELTSPSQSLLPPHDLLFFLVPNALASVALYGLLKTLVTAALLAVALFLLCHELERPAWSPALFLLCVMQNVTLDSSYFYFADTPFMAVVALSLAFQIRAWRRPDWRNALLSGLGAALPFWIKPANALLYLAIFLVAELVRLFLEKNPDLRLRALGLAGFLPVALAALLCGGFPSIVYLVDANETSGIFVTYLQCTGLLRLCYFPLCLTFFYHTQLLLLLAVIAAVILVFRQRPGLPAFDFSPFPAHLLVPLLLAFGLFGLYFSFGMVEKEMRSLLIILPVFWLGLFWLLDRWRVRSPVLFLVAMAYSACAAAQVSGDLFGANSSNSGDYQLRDDLLTRFPPPHSVNPAGAALTRTLLSLIGQNVPVGGKIAVGTEQMYLTSESLTWIERRDSALSGQPAAYDFANFLTNQGKVSRPALLRSSAILLILAPAFQYSPQVQSTSASLAQFAYQKWMLQDHTAKVVPIMFGNDTVLGVLIVPHEPLTDPLITQAISATGVPELVDTLSFSGYQPRRLSLRECLDILLHRPSKP